jgi:ankyrin repeat protein
VLAITTPNSSVEVFDFLLEKGADPMVMSKSGETILHHAAESCHNMPLFKHIFKIMQDSEFFGKPNDDNETPLQICQKANNTEKVNFILSLPQQNQAKKKKNKKSKVSLCNSSSQINHL